MAIVQDPQAVLLANQLDGATEPTDFGLPMVVTDEAMEVTAHEARLNAEWYY